MLYEYCKCTDTVHEKNLKWGESNSDCNKIKLYFFTCTITCMSQNRITWDCLYFTKFTNQCCIYLGSYYKHSIHFIVKKMAISLGTPESEAKLVYLDWSVHTYRICSWFQFGGTLYRKFIYLIFPTNLWIYNLKFWLLKFSVQTSCTHTHTHTHTHTKSKCMKVVFHCMELN